MKRPYIVQSFYSKYPSGTVKDYRAHMRWPEEWGEGHLRYNAIHKYWKEKINACGLHLSAVNSEKLCNRSSHAASFEEVKIFAEMNNFEIVTK